MEKLKQEFNVLDLVFLIITLFFTVFIGFGLIPAFMVYLISRKVDHNGFKIASYITAILFVITGIGWAYVNEIVEIIGTIFEDVQATPIHFTIAFYYYSYAILFGLPVLGYIAMSIIYALKHGKSTVILGLLLVISITNSVRVVIQIINAMTIDSYDDIGILSNFNTISSFSPYLITLIFAILYWELFVPKQSIHEDTETYELFEETA